MPSFLTNSDPGLLRWSENFSSLLSSHYSDFGISSELAAGYAALHDIFAESMAACDPGVRNKVSVSAKNRSRANLKNDARLLAKIIGGTARVTAQQKITLGLNVRATPTRSGPPTDAPIVAVISVVANAMTIRLKNAGNAASRAKPASVAGACLYSYVGDTQPDDASLWRFELTTTRTLQALTFPASLAPGSTVWITAAWMNGRLQSGPLARPVCATIQFGMRLAA